MTTNPTCRCGFTGVGDHLCHRCGKRPGSTRYVSYPCSLAGMQTKFGARETHGCDECWKEFNEKLKQADILMGMRKPWESTNSPKKKSKRPYASILSAITPSRVIWWKISGIFYGYPQCCIEAFCRLDHVVEESLTGNRLAADMGNGTGFVPCRQCAEKIQKGNLKLKDLISGRKSLLPFPRANNNDMDLILEMVKAWPNHPPIPTN